MPLYEYECEACGVRFEQIQKFSDPHVEVCPSCGGVVHKLTSLPSIRFKGSGWYVTDYAKKPSSGSSSKAEAEKKADSNSDSAKESGKDSGSKKDSKPKTESTPKSADKK